MSCLLGESGLPNSLNLQDAKHAGLDVCQSGLWVNVGFH